MKYYVTFSEYYPIYEPAEGGYYYEGKKKVLEREYSTFKKAKRKMKKLWNCCKDDTGFWSCPDKLLFGQSNKYIGDGYICEMTRKPVKEHGWEPYC